MLGRRKPTTLGIAMLAALAIGSATYPGFPGLGSFTVPKKLTHYDQERINSAQARRERRAKRKRAK